MNREQMFCSLIIWFELFVTDGPVGLDSFFVFELGEILFSEPGKCGAINLGIAANEIVNSGGEWFPGFIVPSLVWFVAFVVKDRFRPPVFRFLRKKIAAFNQQNFHPGIFERIGESTSTHAGSDADKIVVRHRTARNL